MRSIRSWLRGLAVASSLLAGTAAAQTYDHSVYLDLDNNAATGCNVATAAGPVNGVEVRITATVSGTPPMVTSSTRAQCAGGVFGAAQPQAAAYAVGLNNGINGSDVIELGTSLAGLGQGGPARLTFVSGSGGGADLVSGIVQLPGGGAVTPIVPILVPATGLLALLAIVGLVLLLARRHPAFGSSVVLLLVIGAGAVWAANFVVDGQVGDWTGVAPLATDANNDSTTADPRIEIVAVFAATEAGNLFMRVDVQDAQTPANSAPVANDAALSVNENAAASTVVGGVTATDANAGQVLTYAITAGNGAGAFAINAGTGSITVANPAPLNFETTPSFTLTVTVSDNGVPVMSDTATVTITVLDVNEAPVLADAARAVAEDSAAGTAVGAPLAGTDPDAGDTPATFTYAITGGNTNGAFAIANTGQITVANASAVSSTGTFTLTVSLTDDGGLSDTATVTITVTDQNDAPTFTNEPYVFSRAENSAAGSAVGSVTATDADAGQTLAYAITAGNTGGAFAIDNAGQITVASQAALDFEATPVFTLTVTVTDNGGVPLTDTATVTINLTDVNEAPVATDATFAVSESAPNGTPVGTAPATDPDLDPPNPPSANATLAYAITGGSGAAVFAIDAGTGVITTTAAPVLANSPYTLNVTVTDGGAAPLSDTSVITINVTDQNDAPVANDAVFALPENSAAGTPVGTVTATDADAGQTRTFAITAGNGAGGFAIDANTGAITVANAAALDFETTPSFVLTVTVTDNGTPPLSDTAQVTINLGNANDAPVANDTGFTIAENSANNTVVGTFTGTDPDAGQTLVYSLAPGSNFQIDPTTGQISVADGTGLNFEAGATQVVTVIVTDNGAPQLSDSATVTITLTDVNEAPVATDASFSVIENSPAGTAVGTVSATDVDGGANGQLQFAITAGNTNNAFAINAATGAITVATPSEIDFGTTFNLTVSVTDQNGAGLADTAAVTVTVDDVNEAPTAINLSNNTVAEDASPGAPIGVLTTVDPDAGNTHTYSLACATPGADDALVAIAGSNLTAVGPYDFETKPTLAICVRSTDGGGLFFDQAFTIGVTDADDAPIAVDDAATVNEDSGATAVDVLGNDQDPDGGTRDITLVTQPANGIVLLAANVVTYQPNPDYCNTQPGGIADIFTYTLSPGGDVGQVSMTVTCINDAPVVTTSGGATAFTEDGGPVAVDAALTVTDADSAQLAGATVSIASNFTNGQDVLAFTPVGAISGSYNAGTGMLTLSGSDSVANYQAALRSVTYDNTSMNPATAARSITFVVNDGALPSNTAAKAVSVGGSNDAPVVTASAGTTAITEDAPAAIVDAGVTVSDVDNASLAGATVRVSAGFDSGDVLGFTNQNGISGSYNAGTGVLTLSGSSSVANYQTALASVTFATTAASPTAAKTIEFVANDGTVNSAPALRALAVTNVNDAPVVTTSAGNASYTENAPPSVIDAGLTLSDADSATLTGATVSITSNFDATQDVLGFVDQGGITGSYNAGTGVLTLSGSASPVAYETALRTVTFANGSEGAAVLARTITFTADDGALTGSNTRGLTIVPVNDPPVAVADAGSTDEDTTLNVGAGTGVLVNDTDVDPVDTKTVIALNGSATLTGLSAKGAAVTINADGSYSYNPGTVFQGLSTGQTDTDTFTYTMRDAANAQSTATVTITINGVSDAPVAGTDSFDAVGNTGLFVGTSKPATDAGKEITGSVLANDTDVDTPAASLVAVAETKATTQGGSVTIETDGNFTYHPDDADLGADSFTYTVSDGVASAVGTVNITLTGQVWYVRNTQAAGGDGTSDTPFDTLAEAEAASGTGDTVYVFDGNNTSSGLATGYVMNTDERLIGEAAGVSIDPDLGGPLAVVSLHAGTGGARPTLAASNEDVVVLATNALLQGFEIDPSGAGGGIFGGAGVGGVLVANVGIVDAGTGGTQPGVDLDGTTGAINFDNLTVQTNGGTGVRLNNAASVLFTPASPFTIATTGAPGLVVNNANLGTSQIDSLTVSGSATGGVSLAAMAGTLTLDAATITTSGGTGFAVSGNTGSLVLPAGGTHNVASTGGPALDLAPTSINAGSDLNFDTVTSSGSPADGINLDGLGAETLAVGSGSSVGGAAGIAVDINGGSGDLTLPVAIGDGTGASVEITNRSGGTIALSANIVDGADAGGGIAVSGMTGGNVNFTGATHTLNTGASAAVSFLTSSGGTLSFTGGALDIDTTSGNGFDANAAGAVEVTGTNNSVASGTGIAVRVADTDITANGVRFLNVSANGGANGIVVSNTGATGSFTVSGSGTIGSGGTIQNTSGDGASFSNTRNISLDGMTFNSIADNTTIADGSCDLDTATGCAAAIDLQTVTGVVLDQIRINGDDGTPGAGGGNAAGSTGIAGHAVNGLTLTNSVLTDIGESNDENAILMTDAQGTFLLQDVTVTDPSEYGVRFYKFANTALGLTLRRVTVQDNINTFGEAAFSIRGEGGTANVLVDDSDLLRTDGPGVDAQGLNGATVHVTVQSTQFSENRALPHGVNLVTDNTAVMRARVAGNTIADCALDSDCSLPIDIDANRTSNLHAELANNTLTGSGIGTGIEFVVGDGATGVTNTHDNNVTVNAGEIGATYHARFEGFGGGDGDIHVTLEGNTFQGISSVGLLTPGVQVLAGSSTGTHDQDACVNTATGQSAGNNTINGTNTAGLTPRFESTQRTGTGFLLQGFAGSGTDVGQVGTYYNGNNTSNLDPTLVRNTGTAIVQYAAGICQTPTAPTVP